MFSEELSWLSVTENKKRPIEEVLKDNPIN